MVILFDQGTPLPLRMYLSGHTVVSAFEKGWNELENGEQLSVAEAEGFDALITTDQNLRYQQNFASQSVAIIVLLTTSWPRIEKNVHLVTDALGKISEKRYAEISFPKD